MAFEKIKRAISSSIGEPHEDEYLEIDLEQESEKENKVIVKVFTLKQYEDVERILTSLRQGYTIAVIDFKTLKQKDPIELKRAISKVKKTADALEGSIAGHENIIIVTPSFAKIHKEVLPVKEKKNEYF